MVVFNKVFLFASNMCCGVIFLKWSVLRNVTCSTIESESTSYQEKIGPWKNVKEFVLKSGANC